MINLHDDETTAVIAGRKLLETTGGLLIKIENGNKRNIRFQLANRSYQFDLNRIFSHEGIKQTLASLSRCDKAAINEVEKFANRILQLIPQNPTCIIALHNNSNGEFSITSYYAGEYKRNGCEKNKCQRFSGC